MTLVRRLAPALRPNGEGIRDLALAADGNIEFVRDAEAVGQHVEQRLGTFEGWWFLDTSAGVAWLERILGRQFDPALSEAVIKTEVLETDGVTGIEAFDLGFSKDRRSVDASRIVVETEYDEEDAP